jgi:arginyl-tRNA synthetase
MKLLLQSFIDHALKKIGISASDKIQIDYTRDRQHGDFASNIALLLAKSTGRKPRDLANDIISHIPPHAALKQIQIAGAGFINFFVTPQAWEKLLHTIFEQKDKFGHSHVGKNKRVHIEFVSSNPTGPLHVGHGRGAAYGAAIADLLSAVGCHVHREYYLNDAGRQMDILAVSIWLRYLELCGVKFHFPSNAYQGDYIYAIARQLQTLYGLQLEHPTDSIFTNVPSDNDDKEAHIDAVISNAKNLLGTTAYRHILSLGTKIIIDDIRDDLMQFGINYQEWFSEQSLFDNGAIDRAINFLREKGHLYDKEGALWFRSTDFGDDKDRVVVRENGANTYFASDIAYHLLKFERGFNQIIDILGADHHGYIPRLKAIIQALGHPVEQFHAPIVQFATLYRGTERVPMSTRAGSFVTLRELREEVGKDAARFFYVSRKADQHMDFDLELAKSQSNDNPVYYIQYAHARICSVFRQMTEKKYHWELQIGLQSLDVLDSDAERQLFLALSRYTDVIEQAALQFEPHLLAYFLRELADAFHSYYNTSQFLIAENKLRHARLCLVAATRQVLANGLQLLGVSAPESM